MRSKLLLLLGVALMGACALGAGSQVWISFMLEGVHSAENITGHELNAALSPVAIALIAAALALTIAGPVFRRVLGVLVALLGAGIAALTLGVLASPRDALSGRVAELTGLTGGASPVVWQDVSIWPTLSLVTGVVALFLGVWIVIVSGKWVSGGRKYGAAPIRGRSESPDRISDWDALSDGADPSDDIR